MTFWRLTLHDGTVYSFRARADYNLDDVRDLIEGRVWLDAHRLYNSSTPAKIRARDVMVIEQGTVAD